jgi:hypothetical protein
VEDSEIGEQQNIDNLALGGRIKIILYELVTPAVTKLPDGVCPVTSEKFAPMAGRHVCQSSQGSHTKLSF